FRWPKRGNRSSSATPIWTRVGPVEGAVGDRNAIFLIRKPDRCPVIFRIERNPAIKPQTTGRAGYFGENHRDYTIFGPLGIAHLDAQHIGVASRNQFSVFRQVLIGVE